ncbi:probable LRR receptor-like serine/threonine-protein kinase At1g05700 isoform X3 [Zea mays]|uniref:probable LRR receptor-like serine/threonine-protein kinase At1g05700 isoform X3 n=1 Tax=Zea mays TaxID=4577 RepID=UPI001651FCE4|nr:probable LRR receptor-like serine/threonine-protein kinase At1g05700 isoform X3 [Zea mays]
MKLSAAVLFFSILLQYCTSSGQPDSRAGFISIDCGIPENSTYQDLTSTILYVSDRGFVTSGENRNISAGYISPSLAQRYYTVRAFASGVRNCYTLPSLVAGNKYLVRAAFYYADYDGLSTPPVFDLYLGASLWHEVRFRDAAAINWMDVVAVAPTDFLQVCLVNKGTGTPFISGLDLRPLRSTLYPEANASQSLVMVNANRCNVGPTDKSVVRYPLDPHDRIWLAYGAVPAWTEASATSVVRNYLADPYDAPSAVMQSAATPSDGSVLSFSWDTSDDRSVDASSATYLLVLYFAELQRVSASGELRRQFDIAVDGTAWNREPYSPPYLFADSFSGTVQGQARHSVSLTATRNATLPPLLNAMEVYLVRPVDEAATDPGDAKAMIAIQEAYVVSKNWMGDPCAPKAFAWEGLDCTTDPPTGTPRITALNLSSSGLTGPITTYFGDLKALQYLDLSHNNLSGSIPDCLGQLPFLVFLNDLRGPVPYTLLQKSHNGTLSLRLSNNPNLSGNGSGPKKLNGAALLSAIIIPTVAATALSVTFIALLLRALKEQARRRAVDPTPRDETALLENREFSYRELKHITKNFSLEIGRGGFGAVFLGYLGNGNPVAVKIRSESSSQGGKEFLAEAQHLTRVHHKNLVSLIGYCKDKDHFALVYEYMPEGNLQDHLRLRGCLILAHSNIKPTGCVLDQILTVFLFFFFYFRLGVQFLLMCLDTCTHRPLTWQQRLQIALDAAQGLEYLHVACKPALIHRDVKSRNILLTTGLGAKIADFGLTKAFSDSETHITTEPAGTMGYLDPEYYRSYRASEKSDVYSFGVVLLELVTGQSPVVPVDDSVSVHVGEWVQQSLDRGGGVESVVDPSMGRCERGDYDVNSVWKVADLALRCRREASRERPTMTDVVAQIRESVELEAARRSSASGAAAAGGGGGLRSCAGERDAFEVVEGSVGETAGAAPGPAMI